MTTFRPGRGRAYRPPIGSRGSMAGFQSQSGFNKYQLSGSRVMSPLSSLEENLRLRMLLAIGCSLCFAAPQAWSQVTAHAAVTAPSPDAQLKQLRQQLSALEGRVHELEKKADDVKN